MGFVRLLMAHNSIRLTNGHQGDEDVHEDLLPNGLRLTQLGSNAEQDRAGFPAQTAGNRHDLLLVRR